MTKKTTPDQKGILNRLCAFAEGNPTALAKGCEWLTRNFGTAYWEKQRKCHVPLVSPDGKKHKLCPFAEGRPSCLWAAWFRLRGIERRLTAAEAQAVLVIGILAWEPTPTFLPLPDFLPWPWGDDPRNPAGTRAHFADGFWHTQASTYAAVVQANALATVVDAEGGNREEPAKTPAPKTDRPEEDEGQGRALTKNDRLVMCALYQLSPDVLLGARELGNKTAFRLSDKTIFTVLKKLEGMLLAERPEGDRSGWRLTTRGRMRARIITG